MTSYFNDNLDAFAPLDLVTIMLTLLHHFPHLVGSMYFCICLLSKKNGKM